jgi:hypothetical protein
LKIRDHRREEAAFTSSLHERIAALKTQPAMHEDFLKEIRCFLPAATVRDTIENESYWRYLTQIVNELGRKVVATLKQTTSEKELSHETYSQNRAEPGGQALGFSVAGRLPAGKTGCSRFFSTVCRVTADGQPRRR